MSLALVLAAAAAVVLVVALAADRAFSPPDRVWRWSGPAYKLPPGPPGAPVVGNLLQFMEARRTQRLVPYLTAMRQYGEMTTLHLGSQTWILLNSKRAAADVISKQGRITHERPPMPVASGLVSGGLRTVIRRTAAWSEGRRVMHHLLSGTVLRVYGNWQEAESLRLLNSYLTAPELWYAHHFRYSTAVLYRLVMGERLAKTKAELDAYQQVTMEFVRSIGSSAVDFFPALAALVPRPLQLWRPFWAAMGARHRALFEAWWDPILAAVRAGTAKPSFVRDTLLHPDVKYKGDGDEAMYLATSVIAAGGDNTRMTLNTFIMAMASTPAAFAKARAEIDAVCCVDGSGSSGSGTGTGTGTGTGDAAAATSAQRLRLPRLDDMAALPYLAATIKEVLRWRPTVPVVPPHALTQDLQLDGYGYSFPAGVSFVINTIAIAQEEADADAFRPERWLDGTGSEALVTHGLWAFGGGRRICVGYRVAQQAMFVAMARLIFCFDITSDKPLDTTKLNHVTLDEPFAIRATVRSAAHEALIRRDYAANVEE